MKYTFSFKEINYGSVEIEALRTPTRAEVIRSIENGNAYFKDTELEEIMLVEPQKTVPKNERQHER